jgi:hypothetical protein
MNDGSRGSYSGYMRISRDAGQIPQRSDITRLGDVPPGPTASDRAAHLWSYHDAAGRARAKVPSAVLLVPSFQL